MPHKFKLITILLASSLGACGVSDDLDEHDMTDTQVVVTEGLAHSGLTDDEVKKSKTDYLDLLKEYLIEDAKSNEDIHTITTDEDGGLRFDDAEGNFLSVYYFDPERVLEGDLDGDDISDVLISVTNEGGGGGGNVAIPEDYSVIDGQVAAIQEIQNIPDNKWGYQYTLKGIQDAKVIVELTFYQEDDGRCCPSGEVKTIQCQLKNGALVVVD